MRVLDADGHVFETEATFADLAAEFASRRPVIVSPPVGSSAGDKVWLLEGRALPNLTGSGATSFTVPGSRSSLTKRASLGNQVLDDVEARLHGLDEYGIDMQVLFPTMFLVACVEDVRLEAALLRSYNNYMADACSKSHGRLTWAAPIPWRDPEAATAELRRASDLGAAAIFTTGVIYDRQLNDPLFLPIYEAAGELNLPIAIHLGWGSPTATSIFAENAFFCSATIPVIWGFYFAMASGLLGRFPKLRMGFIETGAEWVPYTINQLRRHYEPPTVSRGEQSGPPANFIRAGGIDRRYYRDPAEWFREGRAFVTVEADEDLHYLIDHLGEDGLMMSSDYPHGDPSADERFATKVKARGDISDRIKEKLLGGNAARFYRV